MCWSSWYWKKTVRWVEPSSCYHLLNFWQALMALLQRCEHNVYPRLQCSSAINENSNTHLIASKQQVTASTAGQRMETPRCSAHPVSPHQPSRAPAVPTAPTSPRLRALALVWHRVNNHMLTDDVDSVRAAWSVKVGPLERATKWRAMGHQKAGTEEGGKGG